MPAATVDLPKDQQICTRRRVQVWLGEHVIAETIAEPAHAARYEAAMRSMWRELRITNTPVLEPR